jgi:UDP-glucose 4-epimerase
MQRNVVATQRLLEALKGRPPVRFVYASSSSVYGQPKSLPVSESELPHPFSPYGVTKLAAEHLCDVYREHYGIATVALRYFSVYGPRQRPDMALHQFCRAALERRPLRVFGDGRQTRDFTFVDDVVSVTKSAAVMPTAVGGRYNVGGGAQITVEEAIRSLENVAGRPLAVERAEGQLGDVRDTAADTTRVRVDLHYEPSVSFDDGLRLEFEWMWARLREGNAPGL